jgi:hypothetical protein
MKRTEDKNFFFRIKNNFFLIGLTSSVWLLLRSGTKPSRITYPCQQTAAANSLFVFSALMWLIPSSFWYQKIKATLKVERIIFITISTFFILVGAGSSKEYRGLDYLNHAPLGLRALASNKVVRVYSSKGTNWDFSSGYYYDHIDQTEVYKMLDRGVRALSGTSTSQSAWQTIMAGYRSGDQVAIKVNNNNSGNASQGYLNTEPQIINAVISGLASIGVPQNDISVYDVSRNIIARQRNGVLDTYPDVNFVDRNNVTWDSTLVTGSFGEVRLPTVLTQSQHLINIHLMKMHSLATITGAMKNHLGSTSSPSTFHSTMVEALGELNDNPHIKDKTRLIINEALFGSTSQGSKPHKFNNLELFPEETPNSIFLAFDPVAMDSVMYDFFYYDRDGNIGPDTFLHGAADNGLGLHEHGALVEGTYTPKDLTYQNIDFLSISLDSGSGDLNLDEMIDVVDVQLCVNVVLGLESDPGIVDRADVNEDGQWNAQDLQEMVNRVLED